MSTTNELQQRLKAIAPTLDIAAKEGELANLEVQAASPDLWSDQEQAVIILAERDRLHTLLSQWHELETFLDVEELSLSDLQALEGQVQALELQAVLSGENDRQAAILTIHAGTGGVDAQDWAAMLQRMFLRFAESAGPVLSIDRRGWRAEVVDLTPADEAGIKRVVIEVRGQFAYGLLKSEAGVHRLVRLSPFNAKNLRQTSFALVEVIPEVEQSRGATIDEKDLRIDVFRAGGHGGQGVNTTDSAVRLTHLPSGIVVSVQNERSQHQNKATAMKILQAILNRLQLAKNAEETALLKGEIKEGSWGNQIRSYVLQPYQMVKDHRTGFETSNVQGVLDGDLQGFIEAYLTST